MYVQKIGTEEQVRLWDKLQSYWSFDTTGTTITDLVGDRTITAANVTWSSAGKRGNCAVMNGTTSTLLTAVDKFRNAQVVTGSASCWFKVNGISSNSKFLFSFEGWIAVAINATTGILAAQTDGGIFDCTGNTNVTDNAWHNVVLTWNASSCTLYLDGVSHATKAMSNSPTPDSSASRTSGLGCNWNGSYYYDGSIDEVAFWSNRELNATDAAALYSAGNGKFYGTKPLENRIMYWYRFNDNTNLGYLGDSYPLKRETIATAAFDDTISTFIANSTDGYATITTGTTYALTTNNWNIYPLYKNNGFTITMWLQNNNASFANFGTPFQMGFAISSAYAHQTDNILIFRHQPLNTGDKKWYVQFYNGLGGLSDTVYTTGTSTANNTNLTMLTATVSASALRFYLNGVYQAQDTSLSAPRTTPHYYWAYLRFGIDVAESSHSGAYPFNGKIYDFKMHDRVLTDAEVATLYSQGCPA